MSEGADGAGTRRQNSGATGDDIDCAMIAAAGGMNGLNREPFNGGVVIELHQQIDVAVRPRTSACLRAE